MRREMMGGVTEIPVPEHLLWFDGRTAPVASGSNYLWLPATRPQGADDSITLTPKVENPSYPQTGGNMYYCPESDYNYGSGVRSVTGEDFTTASGEEFTWEFLLGIEENMAGSVILFNGLGITVNIINVALGIRINITRGFKTTALTIPWRTSMVLTLTRNASGYGAFADGELLLSRVSWTSAITLTNAKSWLGPGNAKLHSIRKWNVGLTDGEVRRAANAIRSVYGL